MALSFDTAFGVAGALIERDGKFLLVKESGGPDRGKWNTPGGRIDVGENPLDSVKREVLEETGFPFTPKYLLGIYSVARMDLKEKMNGLIAHPLKFIFVGDISESQTSEIQEDVSEIKWFTYEEIQKMSSDELRDPDIKIMIENYKAGNKYPLELIRHTVRNT
jgi:ADP-ribose pyrophosphatase YjhB (NUDIX family)